MRRLASIRSQITAGSKEVATFGGAFAELGTRLGEVGTAFGEMAERTIPHFREVLVLSLAAAGVAVVKFTTDAAKSVHELQESAEAIGINIEKLQSIRLSAAQVGGDPDVATLEGVGLVDIDSLKAFLAERDPGASAEIGRANEIVADELRRFAVRRRSDRLAPLIRALRRRGEIVIAGELERFRSRLGDLTPDEREAVEALARGIVSKLLHDPIVQLKERSTPGADDTHAQLLAELFDVRPSSPVNPGGEE
jgi:hypothetical protein